MAAKKRAKKSAKRTTKRAVKRPAKRAAKRPAKRRAGGGLTAKMKPSAALAGIVGSAPLSRGQVTKKIWAYIKHHKLQVPSNMRNVKPDAKLAKVFGGSGAISMFTMTKRISKHLS